MIKKIYIQDISIQDQVKSYKPNPIRVTCPTKVHLPSKSCTTRLASWELWGIFELRVWQRSKHTF